MELIVNPKSALLQALVEGEGYGLQLIDRIKERTGGAQVLLQGSVYPALRALERDGLVRSYEDKASAVPERGGRPRIYYELTAEGLRAAKRERAVVAAVYGVEAFAR